MATARDSGELLSELHASRPGDARIPVLFLLVPVVHVGALAAFVVLRDHQVSLPDHYNDPYPDWSMSCLLSAGALWFLGGIWTVIRAMRRQRVPPLVGAWLAVATVLVLGFSIQMMAFLFP
jgi:hypothetical protein